MNAGLKRKATVDGSGSDPVRNVSGKSGAVNGKSGAKGGMKGGKGSPQPVAQEQKKEWDEKPDFNPRVRDPRIFYAGKQKKAYNQKQVVDALVAADGALTIAAKNLGTTFRHLKRYVEENDKMSEVHAAIDEETLDLAEGTLRKWIEKGNLTATIFYLKTRGKKRGYIEDEKVDMSKLMQPVTIVYHSPRDPALLAQQQKRIEDKTIDITPAATGATPQTD